VTTISENVFLIGYRGTGKSTVAQLLAARLGWEAVDADAVLETRAGRSIRHIFLEDGEATFRRLEAAVLKRLCRRQHQVVATGGGVVLRPGNRRRLREAGGVIWLFADAKTLWRRLQADPLTAERRPDLSVGGLAEIREMLEVREPLYRACANLAVNTTGREPAEVVRGILSHWKLG
jgi:shikimate kinase